MDYESYKRERSAQDARDNYEHSWRVICGGFVVDQTPSRLGDFAVRMCTNFVKNIQSALSDENWVFDGYGGRKSASEWLSYHQERLGIPLSDDITIAPPGTYIPLCPGLKKEALNDIYNY